jgi:hypothetical protein
VVPEAVKLWRESRGAGGEDTEAKIEDAELDLLIFHLGPSQAQPIHFIHLVIQLRWIPRTSTSLQVHQENFTAFRPTKVTTCDIAVYKSSIVNAAESRYHWQLSVVEMDPELPQLPPSFPVCQKMSTRGKQRYAPGEILQR